MSRSVRIAVVAPSWGDPWREEDVVAGRVAAALACAADVDVLVAGMDGAAEDVDGALVVRRFPTIEAAPSRRGTIVRVHLGREALADLGDCGCLDVVAPELAKDMPAALQREMVRGDGSDAPELYEHLRASGYDAVVFAGLRPASTVFGIDAVPAGTRLALLAFARRTPSLALPIYDSVLERCDRVLAVTAGEGERLGRRGVPASKLREVGFALRVHDLAMRSDPVSPSLEGLLPVVRDWTRGSLQWKLRRLAIELRPRHPRVRICLLGRGATRFAADGWTVVRHALSPVDVWRWTSRAIALFEPEADRLLAVPALEAMMYGTPVLAHADSGAAREHAELGNGGLWYRTTAELDAAIAWLRDADAQAELGEQARRWATARYGDVDAFVNRVCGAVLGSEAPLEAGTGIG